jgi:anti-sigma regulatory factor (Ser/Thr protein kinase)
LVALALHVHASSPRIAREAVRPLLDGFTEQTRYRALLLVTEIVANAVRHGAPEGTIGVHATMETGRLYVSVRNPPGAKQVQQRQPDLVRGGGLGLHIVDQLATDWGSEQTASTTHVWFELDEPDVDPAARES